MLTRRQQVTLDFISSFMWQNHYSPTVAEIAEGIGIVSRGVVYRHLKALAAAGCIHLIPNRRRNIQLLSETTWPDYAANHCSVPMLGHIAAGAPLEALPQQESVDLLGNLVKAPCFAIRVRGDSMCGSGIMDDDVVICRPAIEAKAGDIVAALVDHSEVTLKRLALPSAEQVTLLPENPAYQPQTYAAERVVIQGIMVGLVRHCIT